MSNLKKRVCVALASLAVAGGAVLGTGGTASAAPSVSGHVQRVAARAETDGDRWGDGHRDHGWHRDDYRSGRDSDHGWDRNDDHRRSRDDDLRWDRGNHSRWDDDVSYRWGDRHDSHDDATRGEASHHDRDRHNTGR
ncbi:hypothetical protein ABTY98_02195 [Streptomyces sp. NPDC096040]|uniref:hypothetical protein n=1 Tax=Streptomyces sp. NPDC096040 TaxID=3155541 RepID=UPI003330C337